MESACLLLSVSSSDTPRHEKKLAIVMRHSEELAFVSARTVRSTISWCLTLSCEWVFSSLPYEPDPLR